jgi:hypothetical protein
LQPVPARNKGAICALLCIREGSYEQFRHLKSVTRTGCENQFHLGRCCVVCFRPPHTRPQFTRDFPLPRSILDYLNTGIR